MPRKLRKLKKLSLYKSLQIGYLRNEERQARKLKKFGYVLDKELTNNQHLVAYSPYTGKVLFVNAGSESNPLNTIQFVKDWRSNAFNVTTDTFKYTPRFQEDKSAYLKAKKKYGENTPFKLVGHSQGAISVNELAGPNDTGYTYNGSLLKQKDNPYVTNYRSVNDIVSAFSNPNDMKTLYQPRLAGQNFYQAHNINNIKDQPIFL